MPNQLLGAVQHTIACSGLSLKTTVDGLSMSVMAIFQQLVQLAILWLKAVTAKLPTHQMG